MLKARRGGAEVQQEVICGTDAGTLVHYKRKTNSKKAEEKKPQPCIEFTSGERRNAVSATWHGKLEMSCKITPRPA